MIKISEEHSFKVKFDVSQHHLEHYSELIKRELADESELIEQRLKKWPRNKLISTGVALFDLSCRTQEGFLENQYWSLNPMIGNLCPTITSHMAIS